jgi:lysozyme
MRTLLGASAAVVLLIATMAALIASGIIRFNDPSRSDYPVRGIDISHHQGEIDWDALGRSDFDFVYMKATEGGDFRDPRFAENWRGADSTSLAKGAYHFFTFCTPGAEQAANYLSVVSGDGPMLPPAVDIEYSGNCKNYSDEDQIRRELDIFLERLQAAIPVKPILYVTRRARRHIISRFYDDYPIWARNTYWRPTLGGGRAWTIWQFDDSGTAPGIRGDVDLNVYRGSLADLRSLTRRGGVARR